MILRVPPDAVNARPTGPRASRVVAPSLSHTPPDPPPSSLLDVGNGVDVGWDPEAQVEGRNAVRRF